jgi:AraC-like DNA-binding protein/quercetin dioxygenase-like cupin family protein
LCARYLARFGETTISSLPPDMHSSSGLNAVSIRHPAGTAIEEHCHAFGQLSVVISGTMMVTAEAGTWLAPPGRGLWLPPGMKHGARYGEASSLIRISIASVPAQNLPDNCRVIEVTALLRELAAEAVRLSQHPALEEDDLALVTALIVRQMQRPAARFALFIPHGEDPRVRRVTQTLLAEPGNCGTIEDFAKIAGASPRTLARLFQAETGMSFGRWRDHLRVTVAVERLLRGQSITETALDLGYQTASAFTTMFTRILGLSPGKLIKRMGQD